MVEEIRVELAALIAPAAFDDDATMVAAALAADGLIEWETSFVRSLHGRLQSGRRLTPGQRDHLRKIQERAAA